MSNLTTDDFKDFFNTRAWENNVPTMIKLFNYVTTKYPQLIEFAKFYDKKHNEKTAIAFFNRNTRDKYSIEKAAGEYYTPILSTQTRGPYSIRQYAMNYHYCYVLTKTIEFLYTYIDTKDVVNPYIYYAKNNLNLNLQVYEAYDDLKKMFEPLLEKCELKTSPVSSNRPRDNVGTERQCKIEPDIFFSLHQGTRDDSSSIGRNYSENGCNTNCNNPVQGCCKKVTDIVRDVASIFTKLKKEGGKTRNKNKKHYSRRCKNRKNKKSCKKPHK
jgi:hypothetical protein